jgi:hypothetical protein
LNFFFRIQENINKCDCDGPTDNIKEDQPCPSNPQRLSKSSSAYDIQQPQPEAL